MNYKELTYLWSRQTLKNINTFFYSLGLLILGSGLYLFISYQAPSTGLRNLKPIAHIQKLKANPKRKIMGSLSWFKLSNHEDLFQGDRIITNTRDQVVVHFIDDTLLDIAPNSLVVINYHPNQISLKLERGSIKVKPNAKKSLNVIKGKETYQIKAKKGTLNPDLIDIRTTTKGLDLFSKKQGQYSLTSANGKSQEIKSTINDYSLKILQVRPEYTLGQDQYLTLQITNNLINKNIPTSRVRKTSFALNRIEKGKIKSPQPINLSAPTQGIKVSTQKFPLPKPGEYSLVQIDEKYHTHKDELYHFTILPPPTLQLASPNAIPQIMADYNQTYPINWRGISDQHYKFEIEIFPLELQQAHALAAQAQALKSAFEKAIIKNTTHIIRHSIKVKKNEYPFVVKENAIIRYKVKIDHDYSMWSPWLYQKVTVTNPLPVDNEKTPRIYIKNIKHPFVYLALKTKPGMALLFEISKNSKFKGQVFKRKTKKNYIKMPNVLPGYYFWRVKMIDHKLQSPPIPLTVKAAVVDGKFKKNEIFESYNESYIYHLKWKQRLPDTTYHLILKKGKQILLDKKFKSNQYKFTLPKWGIYTWELSAADKNSDFLLPIKQKVRLKLPPCMAPNVANKQIIKYTKIKNKSGYKIVLPNRPDIIKWQLEIFTKSPREGLKLISRKVLTKNYTFWVSNKSGKYYYRIKIVDKWKRISPSSNTGLLIFPISPLLDI